MEANNKEGSIPETVQLFLGTIPSVLHDARKYALIIQGFTELLHREAAGPLNDQQREILQDVAHRAKMLFHVLNQALTLSSIDLHPRAIEPLSYDVGELISQAVSMATHVNKPKSETMNIMQRLEPVHLFADRDDALHVFLQVLDNAIKYTPEYGVITITATEKEGTTRITICDTGVGIQAEHQKRLFQRLSNHYQQLPNELSAPGVGLAIAQAFTQRNKGHIELTKTSSEGSVFTIILPQKQPEA